MKSLQAIVSLGLVLLSVLLDGTMGQAPLQYERSRGLKNRLKSLGEGSRGGLLNKPKEEDVERWRKEELEYQKEATLWRLNDTAIPSHYKVELRVIVDDEPSVGQQFTAPGKVWVDFKSNVEDSILRLHSNLLTINPSSIKISKKDSPDETLTVITTTNDTSSGLHFFQVVLGQPLARDVEYQFYAEFVAPISLDRRNGLFLSTYVDPLSGEERRQAATQMESFHLRQLFPCFDEPHLKATFDVTIIRKDNYTTLGNEAVTTVGPDPEHVGWSIDNYKIERPMSTYLFALVVSDFGFSEADSALFPGKTVRVYAPPHEVAAGAAAYSATASAKLLKHLDDLFLFPYPLSKMDSVAVPSFQSGAMENWGLNIYMYGYLLYYPGESLESERYTVTNVLAHELAHQNFGDLVTCKWWSVIWLNEGFATWVNYFAMDKDFPEFRASEDILNDAFQYSMPEDVSEDTHPLQNDNVNTLDEIDDMFSTITYERGGSINRMMEGFLTKETFIKGLQYYLKDMQFKAAEQDDLWRNLEKAAAEDSRVPSVGSIKTVMDTWTKQSGHPLIRVFTRTLDSIYLSQERYGMSPDKDLWYVPITVVSQDKPTRVNFVPDVWLDEYEILKSHPADTTKWIMVNQDATGYFRVLYDEPLRTKIQGQLELEASVISPLSRSQLLDDYFTLASHGLTSIESALELTKYLTQEDHFTVWDVVSRHMRKPYNIFGGNDTAAAALKNYLLPRVEAALVKVGVEQDAPHIGANAMYRAQLLDWACAFNHSACWDYAENLYQQWQNNVTVNPVPVDIQATIFCTISRSNYPPLYNGISFMWMRYLETPADSPVRTRMRNSFACATDQITAFGVINAIVMNETSGFAASDRLPLLQRMAANPVGRYALLWYLETELDDLISVVGGVSPVASIVRSLSGYFATQEELAILEKFVMDNAAVLAPVNASLQASLDAVRNNIQYMKDVGSPILTWLQSVQSV